MNTRCIVLGLSLMFPLVGSTSLAKCVSSPDHINFTMQSLQYFYLTWQPLNVGCPVQYTARITSLSNDYDKAVRDSAPDAVLLGIHGIDLNSELLFEVESACKNNNKTFSTMSRCLQLAPGDKRTSVRNFTCTWYEDEGIKCIWQHGEITPPDVKYKLLYWFTDGSPTASSYYALEEFWDLLETAKMCQQYSFEGSFVGCTFTYENVEKKDLKIVDILTVVTDESKKIKPFIEYFTYRKIVKLKPPTIYTGAWGPNNTISVKWNASDQRDSQVQISAPSIGPFEHAAKNSYTFQDLSPKVTYTVRVRVRWNKDSTSWSDWSEKQIFEGKNDDMVSLILLVVIPSLAVIAAIFLLIYMKRLKICLCPKIPNPAKLFSGDIQAWIKSDVYNVHSKPETEEICPVYLLESSTTKI